MQHRKQAQEFIDKVYAFNEKAGLLDNGYDDFLESSFQIEEALEGFDLDTLPNQIGGLDAKTVSRQIIKPLSYQGTDVDRLDKACDAVVFAVGSMAKLGLDPSQITRALNIVMSANMAKLGCPRDSHGKLLKPDNFDTQYAPEPKLQALLDERS